MPGKSSLWALLLPQTLNDREIQDMLSKVRFSDIHSESRDNFSNPNSLITLEILCSYYIHMLGNFIKIQIFAKWNNFIEIAIHLQIQYINYLLLGL